MTILQKRSKTRKEMDQNTKSGKKILGIRRKDAKELGLGELVVEEVSR